MRACLPLVVATVLITSTLSAQSQAVPQRCDSPAFRQFDFWVGQWDVTANGSPAGTNRITLEEDGCLIHEHWTGSQGGTGQSFNFYDRAAKQWRQIWIDSSGNPLDLRGESTEGTMTLVGKTETPKGPTVQRITFFNNRDGTVRQLWQASTDDGRTWSVAFDGLYRRSKAS